MTAPENQIRVFCPKHEFPFVTAPTAEIQCRMDAHALSLNFPQGEWWEYCCDCQTFFPSPLNDGKDADAKCPSCERKIARRFSCSKCKVIALESDNNEREKNYHVDLQNGIKPACPACQTVVTEVNKHDCAKIGAMLLTARQNCPFCEKTIRSVAAEQPLREVAKCPQCAAQILEDAPFCSKCGFHVLKDVIVEKRGTEINKTKLLGSLCPNCSTPIPPDSDFCGECGQAVKKSIAPPPAPPKKLAAESSTINLPAYSTTASTSNNNMRNIIIGVSAVFAFIVIAVIASNVSKSSGSTTNENGNENKNYPTMIMNGNSRMSNGRSINNGSAPPSTDYRIGRTGVLATNSRIRSASNKNSEIIGVHYRGAKVSVLDVDTYTTNEGDTTWFRVKVLENGCDAEGKNGCGNDNPNASDGVGWMQASDEGWMNSKAISLQ